MAINIFTHIRRGLFDNVYNCIEKEKVDVLELVEIKQELEEDTVKL